MQTREPVTSRTGPRCRPAGSYPPLLDELPPHDEEAEAAALGCIMLAGAGAGRMIEQLTASDFYDLRHREIFRALSTVLEDGQEVNPLSLHQFLRDQGMLDKIGGREYAFALPDRTPAASCFDMFLETLRDRTARRAMVRQAEAILLAARDTSQPVESLDQEAELAARR